MANRPLVIASVAQSQKLTPNNTITKREMEIREADEMCTEKSRMNGRQAYKKAAWELGEHKIQQSGDIWTWAK